MAANSFPVSQSSNQASNFDLPNNKKKTHHQPLENPINTHKSSFFFFFLLLLLRSITFSLTNMNLPRTTTTTTTTTTKSILLFSPLVTLCVLLSYTDWITTGCSCSALCVWMLPSVGLVLTVTLVIVAARATMVTWITVLVLLAFAGKRRRVLAQHGRKITADVAMHLFRVLLEERGLVAVVCATIVSLMAMVRLREAE